MYKNQPLARNLPAYRLLDGRTAGQWLADINRKYGIQELETIYVDDYEVDGERPCNYWQMWAGDYEPVKG